MIFTEHDLAIAKETLAMLAGTAQLLGVLKDSADAHTLKKAIPALAAEFKPMLQQLSAFFVQLDINAVKQMEDAGIERHFAVALLTRQRSSGSLSSILAEAVKNKKWKTTAN